MIPQDRLKAAIRAFTVDNPDGSPNGAVEHAIAEQLEILQGRPRDLPADVEQWVVALCRSGEAICTASSVECRELAEAAGAYFGEDFRAPQRRAS